MMLMMQWNHLDFLIFSSFEDVCICVYVCVWLDGGLFHYVTIWTREIKQQQQQQSSEKTMAFECNGWWKTNNFLPFALMMMRSTFHHHHHRHDDDNEWSIFFFDHNDGWGKKPQSNEGLCWKFFHLFWAWTIFRNRVLLEKIGFFVCSRGFKFSCNCKPKICWKQNLWKWKYHEPFKDNASRA